MKIKSFIVSAAAFLSATTLPGCSGDEPGNGIEPNPATYKLAGQVEKGPFVQGSTVSVQPLNGAFSPVGSIFNGEITDNAGSFDIGQITLDYPFARLTANGYFFNEVNGMLSDGTITLNSIVDLSNKSTVNVNLLTHLKAQRIQALVGVGKSFAEADAQAQLEVLTQFGLQRFKDKDFSAATITDGSDCAGTLIAVSSLLLNNRSEAVFTEYLSVLSSLIARNGEFPEDIKHQIAEDTRSIKASLEEISRHIIDRYNELGQTVTVPDLRYYFDWNADGIAGNEIVENPQVSLSQTEVHFDKNGGYAEVTVSSNVQLSLQKSDGDLPDINVNPGYLGDFYADQGDPMECEVSFDDDKLNIRVNPTKRGNTQSKVINLYDLMGEVQASLPVILDGDPALKGKLSETGSHIVNDAFAKFRLGISQSYYVERGYTGMYEYFGVKAPMTPDNTYNQKAYANVYSAIAYCNNAINNLEAHDETTDAVPFFKLLRAILYTDMADKWGNIGIVTNPSDGMNIKQSSPTDVLRFVETQLEEISHAFVDTKAKGLISSAQEAFDMPKDIWRIAKANVYLQLEDYNGAATMLQQVIDGGHYSLGGGTDYTQNSGSILLFAVPDEVVNGHTMGMYTYTDVLMARAECYAKSGDATLASNLVKQVAAAKKLTVTDDDAASAIETLRKQLFTPRYFAFQKRNKLGSYTSYQQLWPIPFQELTLTGWHQNPGY